MVDLECSNRCNTYRIRTCHRTLQVSTIGALARDSAWLCSHHFSSTPHPPLPSSSPCRHTPVHGTPEPHDSSSSSKVQCMNRNPSPHPRPSNCNSSAAAAAPAACGASSVCIPYPKPSHPSHLTPGDQSLTRESDPLPQVASSGSCGCAAAAVPRPTKGLRSTMTSAAVA